MHSLNFKNMQTEASVITSVWKPSQGMASAQTDIQSLLKIRKIESTASNETLYRSVFLKLVPIYRSHLKQYRFIRRLVLWLWRNVYPTYAGLAAGFFNKKARKWHPLIKLSDYVKIKSISRHQLIETAIVELSNPKVFPVSEQDYLAAPDDQYAFPEIFVAIIKNAMIYGGTNLTLTEGGEVICHDLYDFMRDDTSEELHGRALIDTKNGRIRWLLHDKSPVLISVAASFVDACATNYAHWMTEVLPRIALFCKDERFKQVPIVINDRLHKNIIESLFLVVGSEHEIIVLPIGRALLVDELYLMSATGYVPFGQRDSKLENHSHGVFSPQTFKVLSSHFMVQEPVVEAQIWPEKIFLRRSVGLRKLINTVELEKQLIANNYVIVEPEKLTFLQQINLFRNAKEIVSSTGGGLATAIFCKPGTQVAVLMGKHESMIYRYWSNMLSPLGIKVGYALGNIINKHDFGIHGDFAVAVDCLVDLLESLSGKKMSVIHSSSYISPKAKLGDDVEIGAFTIIHANVILGDRVKIGAYCEIGISTPLGEGTPLIISDDSLIRSHSVFYESSSFGPGLTTGHHVTVREKTKAGAGFQIGSQSEIQGDCTVGDYVRLQSNVFVGKKTIIGNFVWILPYVVLTNDPTPPSNVLVGCIIEDYASIAAAAVVLPGITVGHHSLVAAQACVTKDVPPNMLVAGVPARIVGDAKNIKLRDGSDRPAYPWTNHFTRGYPESVIVGWGNKDGEGC